MFCVSSFSWENRLTGLFVQTMCLIDRHLQVFLAILYVYVCMYVSVLISSIHRSRKRPMFDLYLGRPITSDIPTISIRETFCCLAIVPCSFLWPSLSLSIVFALADDEHLQQWRKGKMKTSSSKREQIDSDHRLSSSFSRTIIWRCYRRKKTKKRRERTRTIWWRATDARATKTKHKRGRRRLSLLITRRWCTTTTEHLFFLLFCFSLPSSFFLSLSLSISFIFAVVDHRSIRDKEIEQHTTIIISRARKDTHTHPSTHTHETMVGYMIKKNKTTVRCNEISFVCVHVCVLSFFFFFFLSSFIRAQNRKKTDDTCLIGWQDQLMRFLCDKMTYIDRDIDQENRWTRW